MKIRELRKEQKLTQQELVAMAGIGKSKISLYERAKLDPRLSTLRRIAAALGCEVKDII